MTKADDRILEYLWTEGKATPKLIADDHRIEFGSEYIGRRLQLLAEAELIERVGRGIYTLSDRGEDYLTGRLDLRDFPKPE